MIGFSQSHSGPLNDFEGCIQLIPGSYKSENLITFTGIDKVHLKCDCRDGSIFRDLRHPVFIQFCIG